MVGHAPFDRLLEEPRRDPDTSRLRHLFEGQGPPLRRYEGLGCETDTAFMLSRLCTRMRRGSPGWRETDASRTPAGYTYLAQLAAHDTVQSIASLPRVSLDREPLDRDYRAQRLVLDTIYGGGPGVSPACYALHPRTGARLGALRQGHLRGKEPPLWEPPAPWLTHEPARDIPRDHWGPAEAGCRPATRETLIADVRNDQHVIISQLTAFFHELHNIVRARVATRLPQIVAADLELERAKRTPEPADDPARARWLEERLFLATRKVVALSYRRILVQDLLKRLLEPLVFAHYVDEKRQFIDGPGPGGSLANDSRVPVEFSHAAFRFGHAMVQFDYVVNAELSPNFERTPLRDILDRSATRRADLVPLNCDWLVDWSHFFDLGDGRRLNRARRIRPYIGNGTLAGPHVVDCEADRDGGLFYRDLIRGYEAGVATVASLIERLPDEDWVRSELLRNARYRADEIGTWLKQDRAADFSVEERRSLSEDPPLAFFILFEAQHDREGQSLGKLGSIIVAEVFFQALAATHELVEGDPLIPGLALSVFDGAVPESMPALIRYVRANGGLRPVHCPGHVPT